MKWIKSRIRRKIKKYLKIEEIVQNRVNNVLSNENFSPINFFDEDDIFIASFPKSGVTWTQNLITGILLKSDSEYITPKLVQEIIPDVHKKMFYKRLYPSMFFKTHNLPQPEYKKVIHLVRDGRDSLVSFHYYLKLNKSKGPSIDELICNPKKYWPDEWFEHTQKWNENPFNADILPIKYEDLITSPIQTLKNIAEFSGISIDEKLLVKIYNANNLKNLKSKVENYGWDYDKDFGSDSTKFFRKGVVGEYKNELSKDLISEFEKKSKPMLEKYGYEV